MLQRPIYQETVRELAGTSKTLLAVAVERLRNIVVGIVFHPGSRAPGSFVWDMVMEFFYSTFVSLA